MKKLIALIVMVSMMVGAIPAFDLPVMAAISGDW